MVVLKALRSFVLLIFLVFAFYFIAHLIGDYTGHMILELDKDLESCLKEKETHKVFKINLFLLYKKQTG